ncbi:YqcC family protein [Pseudaeromonas sharmana]|uniref:YqcC family protein n=1 Tax=Pseudaeromonas sharmana TaxID=328412 RepID=A0ABV8CSP1_9GAMM
MARHSPDHDYAAVAGALEQIALQLKLCDLWQSTSPPASALQSRLPFCVDTLEFHAWLQFVLLERMHDLVRQRQPLPRQMALYPMATEVYKTRVAEYADLLEALAQLDELITHQPVDRKSCI